MAEKNGQKGEAALPKSGTITFLTGIRFNKKSKKIQVSKRQLTFKKGELVDVGDTGPLDEIDVAAFLDPKKGG